MNEETMSDLMQIYINPATYANPQRTEASERATKLGNGLRMELGNTMTYYYSDPAVPVGKVAIYAPREYKGWPQYVTTLESASDEWSPADV